MFFLLKVTKRKSILSRQTSDHDDSKIVHVNHFRYIEALEAKSLSKYFHFATKKLFDGHSLILKPVKILKLIFKT